MLTAAFWREATKQSSEKIVGLNRNSIPEHIRRGRRASARGRRSIRTDMLALHGRVAYSSHALSASGRSGWITTTTTPPGTSSARFSPRSWITPIPKKCSRRVPCAGRARRVYRHSPRTQKDRLPQGVMHCYTGSLESARIYLDLGFHISFSGSVTFKNATEVYRRSRGTCR